MCGGCICCYSAFDFSDILIGCKAEGEECCCVFEQWYVMAQRFF